MVQLYFAAVVERNEMDVSVCDMESVDKETDATRFIELLQCLSDPLRNAHQLLICLICQVINRFCMLFGNDERVSCARWTDLEKRRHIPIFVDAIGGNVATCNLTKETVHTPLEV